MSASESAFANQNSLLQEDLVLPCIVMVVPSFAPAIGGVETHVEATAKELLDLGYQVVVVTAGETNQTRQMELGRHRLTVISFYFPQLPVIGLVTIWVQLLRLLPLFTSATIIHIHDVLWWFLPVRLLLPMARVVLTMHGWEGVFPIPYKLRFLKQLSAVSADRLLLVGDFIAKYYGVRGDSVTYGAAALTPNHPQQATVPSSNKPLIAYAGRLAADTGLREVVTAARHFPQVEWQFYGAGPSSALAQSVGALMGWSSERPWLQTADIVIASGYLSVWECLAAGKSVIVVAHNSLKRDYFQLAPFAAQIITVTTAAELETAIKLLLAMPAVERHQRLAQGKELAKKHTWRDIAVQYARWYQELQEESFFSRLTHRLTHIRWSLEHIRALLLTLLLPYLAVFFGSLALICLSGWQIKHSLSSGNILALHRPARLGGAATAVIDSLTFHHSPEIKTVRLAFTAVSEATTSYIAANQLFTDPTTPQPLSTKQLAESVPHFLVTIGRLDQTLCQSSAHNWLAKKTQDFCQLARPLSNHWEQLSQLAAYWLGGERKLLIVLQNTQELRATGGFMGSYALVDFSGQTAPTYALGDIYEPDGQFHGFVSAPAGVDEFLSSGKGLRLPDANWQPDFPSSAQTILQYFAFGNKHGLDGVMAINLSLMEKILQITGPLPIPDYHVTVTAENVADVARADRQNFFPGSLEKQHFLQALTNQVKFALAGFNRSQWMALTEVLLSGLQNKEIQLYQVDDTLQQAVDGLGWSGRQSVAVTTSSSESTTPPLYLMLVESNVGINKANRAITRSVVLDLKPAELAVQLQISNQNASVSAVTPMEKVNGMGYVNYQRLFVPQNLTVHTIEIGGKKLPSWHEQLITTQAGEVFNQIGFVFPVPQGQTKTARIILHPTADSATSATVPLDLTASKELIIQHQSGLPETTYILHTPTLSREWQVAGDMSITF